MLARAARAALAPAAAAIVVGVIGLTAVWAGYPWLIASLGSTVALQAAAPTLPMSRARNAFASHIFGLGSAWFALYVTGAMNLPSFSADHQLTLVRVGAAALAMAVSISLELAAKATHAPAASTTLLVVLGLIPATANGVISVICGVALVTFFGEIVRRLSLRSQ